MSIHEYHNDFAVTFIKALPWWIFVAVARYCLLRSSTPAELEHFAPAIDAIALADDPFEFELLSLPPERLARLIQAGLTIDDIRQQPEVHSRLAGHILERPGGRWIGEG
jgi:hypothetical protein